MRHDRWYNAYELLGSISQLSRYYGLTDPVLTVYMVHSMFVLSMRL